MSKQLQKLNYSPVEVEISVIGSSTPTTGSLTITQIKTLLASDQNYIKYTINASTSEYLYFTNFTNNTAFYGADLYNATTSVYYRHLIKISYSSDLSSATWNYYNIPIITGSSSDLQEKLVSGSNIKTVNNNSLLGSGNLAISEFPERSETDATLSQIAGLNSNGLPDVGKVAAANMDSGSATNGQVLTADGSGGCAWANAGGFYLHTIVTSAYTFYIVNKDPEEFSGTSLIMRSFLPKIASTKWIGVNFFRTRFAYDIAIAVEDEYGGLTQYRDSPNIIQKGNAISYFGNDGQEVTILASDFGTFVSDTVTERQGF